MLKHKIMPDVEHLEYPPAEQLRSTASHLAGEGLGTVQMEAHGHVILVPTPSNDPNDPLNWSQPFKIYITVVVCLAVFLSNFLAAGPTVDIVTMAIDFTGLPPNVSRTAYLFTTSALWQGAGMFLWMPLITKFGRRICYVTAYIFFTLCVIWCALATDYNSELTARMGIGLFSGGGECLGPLTITDMFFAHERGRYMALYQTFLSMGSAMGIIICGLIVHGTGSWRDIYWISSGLVGATTVLVVLTFPETAFRRHVSTPAHVITGDNATATGQIEAPSDAEKIREEWLSTKEPSGNIPKKSYIQLLTIYNGTYTAESFHKIFLRPFGMIILPAVFWAAMVWSVTIGFLVAVTSNYSVAFGVAPYYLSSLDASLLWVGAIVGAILGIPCGGYFGDLVAEHATRKNHGLREPEMRLPALFPSVVAAPLGLVLYGVGIQHGLHWICSAVGIGLLSFAVVAGNNIVMVYAIDVYKPIAGEVVVAILGFKGIIGFALAFGTNLWVDTQGYQNAFGEMAAISAFFLLLVVIPVKRSDVAPSAGVPPSGLGGTRTVTTFSLLSKYWRN